jgi:hypothetical protein
MKDWKSCAIVLLLGWALILQLQLNDYKQVMKESVVPRLDLEIQTAKRDLRIETDRSDGRWKAALDCARSKQELKQWTACVYDTLSRQINLAQ